MKNLVKLFLIGFAVLMTSQSFAQNLILKGGLNMANLLAKDEDGIYSEDFKMNLGFHAGLTGEFPLSDALAIEVGALASTKGYKIKESFLGIDIDASLNTLYLDIPVNLKAYFEVAEGFKIYGAAGPYVGIGLAGNVKATGGGETEKEAIEWGNDEDKDDLKRLDYGLSLGAGVEFKGIQLGVSYGLGLANISPYSDFDTKVNNRVLAVSLGYRLGGK